MANTTNFGWETPDDTDLVKDGAAAIRTVAGAIDTSLVDLKGGTTGQILAKTTNTDMDFSWITNDVGDITAVTAGTGLTGGGTSGAVSLAIDTATTVDLNTAQTLTNKTLTSPVLTTPTISTVDAKGDLLAGTADNTIARLAVGANDTILTADSSTATGLKWAAPAGGGGMTLLSTTTLSGATTTISTIDQTYKDLIVIVQGVNKGTDHYLFCEPNNVNNLSSGTYSCTNNTSAFEGQAYTASRVQLAPRNYVDAGNTDNAWAIRFFDYASSSFFKPFLIAGTYTDDASQQAAMNGGGGFRSTTAISSLVFNASSGTFSGGTVRVYGVK